MIKQFIISAAVALTAMAATTSCSDDNTVWSDPTTESLKVVSHDTSFPPVASQGKVVVKATGPVTVKTDAGDWLTTSVEGNTVNIQTSQNNSLEGRTATLTISADGRQTNISVIQSGAYFEIDGLKLIKSNDSAHSFKYKVNSNLPIEFWPSEDFISTSYDDKAAELTVSVTRNRTGHIRQGFVNYKFGDNEGSIPVKQCDFYRDLEGDYMFVFTDNKDNQQYYYDAVLAEDEDKEGTYKITIDELGINIPVRYNEENFSLSINGGQLCGYDTRNGGRYPIATGMWSNTEGYITFVDFVSVTGEFKYGKIDSGEIATVAQFVDDGTCGAFIVEGIVLELFTSMPATNDNRMKVVYKNLLHPYIIRIHEGKSNVSAQISRAETAPSQSAAAATLWQPASVVR
ncbi:MAG: BACON domain-containing protein [Muribaculaceae bacterium]|nr:BACON domain-containing protein [Muribaculaceae bacterium]